MMGSASTPKARHPSAINSKLPKCSTRISPSNPIHPRSNGKSSGTNRAQPNNSAIPAPVLAIAQHHCINEGRATRPSPRKLSASIPGHPKRYAQDRHAECATSLRARHHDSHFNPKKIAAASAHMNPQAGSFARSDNAAATSSTRGKQPRTTETRLPRSTLPFATPVFKFGRSRIESCEIGSAYSIGEVQACGFPAICSALLRLCIANLRHQDISHVMPVRHQFKG